MDMNFNFDIDGARMEDDLYQESAYNAGNSSFRDFMEEKFTSFDPEAIVSGGNNKLKSGQFDMDIEDSDLALGYSNDAPALEPGRPGRFF
jgi:hypothetical protein